MNGEVGSSCLLIDPQILVSVDHGNFGVSLWIWTVWNRPWIAANAGMMVNLSDCYSCAATYRGGMKTMWLKQWTVYDIRLGTSLTQSTLCWFKDYMTIACWYAILFCGFWMSTLDSWQCNIEAFWIQRVCNHPWGHTSVWVWRSFGCLRWKCCWWWCCFGSESSVVKTTASCATVLPMVELQESHSRFAPVLWSLT